MTFSITYKPLFSVKLLHLYFLNKGSNSFFGMNSEETNKQLAGYDVLNFLKITPSTESSQKLLNHRIVFKSVNTGFTLWTQVSESQETLPLIPLNNTLELTFLLTLVNHTFINFTELDTSNAGKLYFFSNKRLATEAPSFPLIGKTANKQPVDGSYIPGTESTTELLNNLSMKEKQNLFGLIRICMKGENASMDIINNQGEINDPASEFQVVFGNRETIWRYFFDEDQQVKNSDDVKKENGSGRQLITRKAHPLTETGFVSVELDGKELPNPDASSIKPDSSDNKIYSEIYM